MDFLHALAALRTPFLDSLFLGITELGGELLFTVFIVVSLWCLDKQVGFWMFSAWIFGSASGQFLKVFCAVPRPWVRDSSFDPVRQAITGAGGYSFPSGHTQSAAGLFGSAFIFVRRNGWRLLFVLLTALIGFSRLYLGVHTPADVFVGLLIGILPVLYVFWALRAAKAGQKAPFQTIAQLSLLLLCGLFLAYALLTKPAVADEFFHEGLENAWKLFGASLGLVLSWRLDQKLPFDTKAPLVGQLGKGLLGGLLALFIKGGLKTPLLLLFSGHGAADGLRYFLLAVFTCALWPMTFRFWANVGEKKETAQP